ncbi:hypothetical protein AX15_000639 [Amanita polypyramis BW_CC]|nr:hypothetical protein AX15_000639 [Amanita polypyramis BW_CC]
MSTRSPIVVAPTPRLLSTTEGFFCGGIAACLAVTVSNPAEVAKTRLQLQGELAKKTGVKVYNNVLDVFKKTFKNEGVRGLQRGLTTAYAYQLLFNGSRLGFYEPFRCNLNKLFGWSTERRVPLTSIVAGAASGAVGAMLGNPLFLIKARMQARILELEERRNDTLTRLIRLRFQLARSVITRVLLTVYPQYSVRKVYADIIVDWMPLYYVLAWPLHYNLVKNMLVKYGIMPADSTGTFLVSSAISSVCVCLVVQPADTATTRMYNQPTIQSPNGKAIGTLYKNPIDCLWKTFKTEGVRGWYKGTRTTRRCSENLASAISQDARLFYFVLVHTLSSR